MSTATILVLVASVFFALAALGGALILRSLFQQYSLLKYPTTPGTMLSCEAYMTHTSSMSSSSTTTSGIIWKIRARYSYTVDGTPYTGTNLSNIAPVKHVARMPSDGSRPRFADEFCQRYAPGTSVDVHYNPLNPKDTFLYFTSPFTQWTWAILPVLSALVGWFFFFLSRHADGK